MKMHLWLISALILLSLLCIGTTATALELMARNP